MGLSALKAESDREAESRTPDVEPVRLLIVDDVEDNRAILARRFRKQGFEITEAADGIEALRLIEQHTYDAVLLDVMMPDIDGIEVLRRIRLTQSAVLLPVVMVTARAFSEDLAQAMQQGANDYITKPVDFTVALARVTSQVTRRRAELELLSSNHALEDAKKLLEDRVSHRATQLLEARATINEEVARRKATEDKIAYLAHHDMLTGLASRFHFETHLRSLTREEKLGHCVLFIDLDGFKNVNDTLGHEVGDALLKGVAAKICHVIGEGDMAARFGGDEFAILHSSHNIEESAASLAKRILKATSERYTVDGHQVFLGSSIGVAIASDEAIDPSALMKRADLAMYRAKAKGRGQYCLFHPEMEEIAQNRRNLELELRAAISRGEFTLVYQPIVNIKSGCVVSLETLLRWNHPFHGCLSPQGFIELAESTGLIVPIGEWVLRQACQEATLWPEHLLVSVNLSAIQFRNKNLVAVVLNALSASGLHPSRLELEITETALLGDNDETCAALRQLRGLGVRVSLDDFGVGYSGLGYLRSIVVDKIKIDQSFVREMARKKESLAIVRAAVAIAATLGISTIAEGVETEEQMTALAREGCDEAQGFLLARPAPAADVAGLIECILQMRNEARAQRL
jgi:diguanylate cyclase (GGDEF)-like protein